MADDLITHDAILALLTFINSPWSRLARGHKARQEAKKSLDGRLLLATEGCLPRIWVG